jgi:hypothetical protein
LLARSLAPHSEPRDDAAVSEHAEREGRERERQRERKKKKKL